MARDRIEVHGLVEFRRDFARMDRKLRTEWDRELRTAAQPVKDAARQIAEAKGLHRTGRLIGSIRIATGRRGSVFVRSTPPLRPSRRARMGYAAIYEYGGRARGEALGPRAFLTPALEREREEVVERLSDVLDRITSEGGFGRGGRL